MYVTPIYKERFSTSRKFIEEIFVSSQTHKYLRILTQFILGIYIWKLF